MAKRIIALMPKHIHYVEPFFGGGAVLLEKDPFDSTKYWGEKSYEQGVSEVANDINGDLMNFWKILQDDETFVRFQRIVQAVPFSQTEWQDAETRQHPIQPLDVEAAVGFFIRCRQSRAGEFKDFGTLSRNRTRRMQNEQASAWWNCVEGLPAVHTRLKRVVILNDDAVKVIRAQDGEKTLFYLDPPYVHSVRATTGNYKYEMTEDDHRGLLDMIVQCKGKVMLSGYPNPVYEKELRGWNRHDFAIDNKASGAKTKRLMTEAIWTNF